MNTTTIIIVRVFKDEDNKDLEITKEHLSNLEDVYNIIDRKLEDLKNENLKDFWIEKLNDIEME